MPRWCSIVAASDPGTLILTTYRHDGPAACKMTAQPPGEVAKIRPRSFALACSAASVHSCRSAGVAELVDARDLSD
jgi:hypothetical protein